MNLKKVILLPSLVGTLLLYFLFNTRELGLCNIYCGSGINNYQDIFIFFPVILFFSLVTYKLKPEVFIAWWRFARLAIPAVFVGLFIISLELHHNPGGWFNFDEAKDMFMYFVIYGIFVIGSFIQIYRGYKK